ncbi:MAG: GDSL-type esterase/lipase family protein [Peptoniphilus sp.]|nr:GDSL-type esterase/lipase family protein [Peptoniphilus sp.]
MINAIGDSLVYGYGVGSENSFINIPHEKVNNYGINGDTSAGVLYRLDEVLDGQIIIILVGVNDFLNGISVDSTTSNIKKILDEIFCRGKKALLCIPFLLSEEEDYTRILSLANDKITKYRENLLQFSHEDLLIVDFYGELQKEPNYSHLFFDGIHPTKSTHDLMRSLLIKSMEERKWI